MVDIQHYVDEHAKAVREAQALAAEVHERDGGPTGEDLERLERAVAHADEQRKRRDTMERASTLEADAEQRNEVVEGLRADAQQRADAGKSALVVAPAIDLRAMGLAAYGGERRSASIDIASAAFVHQRVKAGADRREVLAEMEKRALSVATDTAGGHTVPTTTATTIYDYMHDIGGVVRAGATVITTASGEDLELPVVATHNAPTSTLETSEGAAIAATEDTLGQVTLGSFKYTGGMDASRELLTDTTSDIEGFIVDGIFRTIGIKMETRFTLGTGTSMPKGVINAPPAADTTTTAASNAIARDDVFGIKFNLDPFYLSNIRQCRWMMDSAVYAKILEIPVGTGDARPLFQASLIAGEPDMILGAPVTYNQHMPGTLADNDIAAVFGHFGHGYVVRMVGNVMIESSTEALFKNQQIAFIGSVRADGKIRDTRAFHYLKIKA